jgi:hypothetical protein
MIGLDDVIAELDRRGMKPKRSGRVWRACCPHHENPPDGHGPSLNVSLGRNGTVLLHCKGGCRTGDVLAALGWGFRDLFPDRHRPGAKRRACAPPRRSRRRYCVGEEGCCFFFPFFSRPQSRSGE